MIYYIETKDQNPPQVIMRSGVKTRRPEIDKDDEYGVEELDTGEIEFNNNEQRKKTYLYHQVYIQRQMIQTY